MVRAVLVRFLYRCVLEFLALDSQQASLWLVGKFNTQASSGLKNQV